MSLMNVLHGGSGSDAVQIPNVTEVNIRSIKPCYAGVKFDADGNIYTMQANGNWSNAGQWLLFGTNSSFYVVRTIDSGSLTTDAGAGPLVLSTDREYTITNPNWGTTKTTTVTFVIENAATTDLAERQISLIATLS